MRYTSAKEGGAERALIAKCLCIYKKVSTALASQANLHPDFNRSKEDQKLAP